MRTVDRLNQLLAWGVRLDLGVDRDWIGCLGRYEIGFNRKTGRFKTVWAVPSLFSDKGGFDTPWRPYEVPLERLD